MPTPTCGTTIWVQSSATPVSCAAAMTSSVTGASTSSASAAVTAPNSSSRLPTPRCTSSDFTGLAQLTEQLCASKVPVYLTIDLDCLDPSCFPGTGTPEAGGVSFLQLLEAIRTVTKANIVGADLKNWPPTLDTTGVSTATACKVLRELLIALDKGWPGFQV